MRAKGAKLKVADTGDDIRELIADWEIYLGQKSAATQKTYLRAVGKLADWLEANDRDTGIAAIGHRTLTQWMNSLGGAESSRSITYRSVQQFYRWLVEVEEVLDESPMAKVPAPSQKPVPVPVMVNDDLRKLLDTCRRGSSLVDRRDYALLRILIDCGVRIGELAGMTVDCYDRGRHIITVTGKTGTRDLILERPTEEALVRYLRTRRAHRNADLPELWLSWRGSRTGVMTHWGIRQMVERRVEEAGLTGRIYPHKLRHTWAHRWMANGGQTQDLTYNAGWTSPAMAHRYGASAQAERARNAAQRARLADQI